ncbi:hypothetical protein C8R44DRAFT_874326 [Mycena epipterygia]|nr:hypothetical protein C8R44DRAFT_874326 [Mycena epipterygia]
MLPTGICIFPTLRDPTETSSRIKAKSDSAHQLILDMVIRWPSTYAMLHRGYTLCDHVNTFAQKIARDEQNSDKRVKLLALAFSKDKWSRVKNFLALLGLANAAQQAFLSDEVPSMHSVIPALESLHRGWENQANTSTRAEFEPALPAGLNKITDSGSVSKARIFCPALAQESWRLSRKYLSVAGSRSDTLGQINQLHGRKKTKLTKLLAVDLDSDSDDDAVVPTPSTVDSTWFADFGKYIDAVDKLPDDISR